MVRRVARLEKLEETIAPGKWYRVHGLLVKANMELRRLDEQLVIEGVL